MYLYTIVNEADIFFNEKTDVETGYKKMDNGLLEYRTYNNVKEVVRLHSTNPFDYLKPEYQPYSVIKQEDN